MHSDLKSSLQGKPGSKLKEAANVKKPGKGKKKK